LNKIFGFFFSFLVFINAYAGLLDDKKEFPVLKSWVNDYAGIIDDKTTNQLTALLRDYEQKTTNQIFVLTAESFYGYGSIEDFSIKIAEAWKAGNAKKDNGVILVVVPSERKLRIEVGYGLEGVLPDILAGRIINEIIVPEFKYGSYSNGVMLGVASIIKIIGGYDLENLNLTAHTQSSNKKVNSKGSFILLFLFLGFIFLMIITGNGGLLLGMLLGGMLSGGRSSGSSGSGFGGGRGGGFGGGGASGSW